MKIKTTYLYLILLFILPTLATAEVKLSPSQLAEKIDTFKRLDIIWRPSESLFHKLKNSLSIQDPAHREWSLDQQLKMIAVDTINTNTRQWLQQLTHYQSETKTWLNDGGYKIEVTVWKIADQAKGILARWEIAQAKKLALKSLSEANWRAILTPENKNQQQGYLQAIHHSPVETLLALGNMLSDTTPRSGFETKLLWGIAQKTQNSDWMKQIISTANAKFSTELMKQNLNSSLVSSEVSIELLKAAITNPRLASFALLELGNYVDTNQSVAPLLFDYLKHKKLGGSAARALSKTTSIPIQRQLKALSQSEQPLIRARATQVLDWQQKSLEEKR